MAEIVLQAGARIDIPNKAEVGHALGAELDARDRQRAKGWKHMYLPETLSGTPASSALTLGAAHGQIVGPESGYAWVIMRLVVGGLTAGTTPDVVNLYRNDNFSRPPLWQFNGNNFGYTFTRLSLVIHTGETLSLQNVGAIAATGPVTLAGELLEIPQEMLFKVN